jgi:hypothetical protein
VQDIGIAGARVTAVTLGANSRTLFLELRGLLDAPHITDKDTRIRLALSLERAAELQERLAALRPPPEVAPAS